MILKLNPGQRVAFMVSAVEQVEGNYGPQYKFSGTTPDDANATLFLNVEPATRQLERVSLTIASVIGQTVEIEKVERDGKKFTNINRLNGAAPVTSTTVKAGPQTKQPFSSGGPLPWEPGGSQPEHPKMTFEKLDEQFAVYDVCLAHAHDAAKKAFGNDVTDTAVAAMAAVLYIQAAKVIV